MKLKHISRTKLVPVGQIKIPEVFFQRITCGIDKMDQLMGGPAVPGIMPGSSFTITGMPGSGKSTLMLQTADALTKKGYACAVVSGEESIHQIAYNAHHRLKIQDVLVANMTDIDAIADLAKDFDLVIIDSFQAMHPSPACAKAKKIRGPKAIEKYCVETFTAAGKAHQCCFGFVLHVTKNKQYKGGTIIAHTVDANYYIYVPSLDDPIRWIECHKNRFAPLGKFSAALGPLGYDFTIDAPELTDDQRGSGGVGSGGKAPGWAKGARRRGEIQNLLQHKTLTLAQAAEVVDDMQRARFLMSDLKMQGLFVKKGRGDNAVFTLTEAGKKKAKEGEQEDVSSTARVPVAANVEEES